MSPLQSMAALGVASTGDVIVRPEHKGFAPNAVGRTLSELRGRLALCADGFVTPVLLLNDSALRQNLVSMQQFCNDAGLSLSPHAKTTMSPEIISKQLEFGAWAVTVANHVQARVVRSMSINRVMIANELVDPLGIEWLGRETDSHEEFVPFCYVDSTTGVLTLDNILEQRHQNRPVSVLIEYGVAHGRAGVRTIDEAVHLADLIERSAHLRLAGVAGFEGIVGEGLGPDRLSEVRTYLRNLREVADRIYRQLDGKSEFIVTAGGSCFFELVRDEFNSNWRGQRPIRVVLRSGCYVTHDSSALEDYRVLMANRCTPLTLTPALELWSRVLSCPEPGLAILDFGKRDTGTDAGFPVSQWIIKSGNATIEPVPNSMVVSLNDQHAYLKIAGPGGHGDSTQFAVGDLVGLGISHPCTTLDKWRLIPVVDSDRTLVDIAQTLF